MKKLRAVGIAALAAWLLFSGVRASSFEVPILMYHIVDYADPKIKAPTVTPETFERQMQFLKTHRYQVLPLAKVVEDLKAGKRLKPKTVCITFDDGTEDNFSNAFPILKKLGLPATIFMITDNIGKPGWLSEKQLKILDESGIAIGSHTLSHAFLPHHPEEEVRRQLTESKAALEKILGHPVTLFSYPAGGMTPEIRALVQACGYEGAVTTNYGKINHDFFGLHRIKVKESNGLFNFWAKVTGVYHLGKKRVSYKPGPEVAGPSME